MSQLLDAPNESENKTTAWKQLCRECPIVTQTQHCTCLQSLLHIRALQLFKSILQHLVAQLSVRVHLSALAACKDPSQFCCLLKVFICQLILLLQPSDHTTLCVGLLCNNTSPCELREKRSNNTVYMSHCISMSKKRILQLLSVILQLWTLAPRTSA